MTPARIGVSSFFSGGCDCGCGCGGVSFCSVGGAGCGSGWGGFWVSVFCGCSVICGVFWSSVFLVAVVHCLCISFWTSFTRSSTSFCLNATEYSWTAMAATMLIQPIAKANLAKVQYCVAHWRLKVRPYSYRVPWTVRSICHKQIMVISDEAAINMTTHETALLRDFIF